MTDTHTHIYDSEAFPEGPEAVVERAMEAGVKRFVLPNVNVESVKPLLTLHHARPECTYVAAGLHPCDATDQWRGQLDTIMSAFEDEKPVAIGEIGIDLYWEKETLDRQKRVFEAQITIARKKGLPLIIHCREALEHTLEILHKFGKNVPAVFHSFTGSPEQVRAIREAGDYFFGINGVVTFKNAPALRAALPKIGIDRILLETDSPYLAPVPHRGRRNESAYIPDICAKVAEVLNMDMEKVVAITDSNASNFFGL